MRASETAPLLRIRDATVRKGGRAGAELLAHLSLEIPQGQHTAILGPNGSGKSTLIKLIAQEYRPLANSESVRSLAQMGKTIIFVTHQLQEVIPEVERVVLLKQARVYRDGCKREVLTPEVLSAVFGAAVHVESTTEGYYHMHIAPT